MKKFVIGVILFSSIFFFFSVPEAKAFDPVTMGIAAQFAVMALEKASPYIIRGLANAGRDCLYIGQDMIDFGRLPLGMFQASFLMPFGYFPAGAKNILKGTIAPCKMMVHILVLPIMLCGVNVNI
ncbi:MAG: hypothetical protein A2017_13335 [Lentisphaerae bacterium GWF2_44_16]|nr:MAG: hypothetical protein A2017_13335 [Lentisphaerae bacterium GWF2_44_16]